MKNYVYIMKIDGLYNIGQSIDVQLTKKLLSPDEVICIVPTKNASMVLSSLKKEFSKKRLPESDYYRLNKVELRECKRKLLLEGESINIKPFFSGFRLMLAFIFAWITISLLIINFGFYPLLNRF